jgi:Concanavalin A-like lectin/glucanases superfamily
MKNNPLLQHLFPIVSWTVSILSLTCLLTQPSRAATLTHRYSFALDATDSIAGANGILEGNAVIGSLGGLILDGTNSYVQLPTGLFTNYGSASFELWYADTPVNSTNADLFYFMGTNNNSVYYNLGGYGTFVSNGVSSIALLNVPATGGTNHIVFTVDTNALTGSLYVNGALAAVKSNFTTGSALQRAVTNFLGGNGTSSTTLNFRGSILEFRSYSNAMSALDVAMTDTLGPGQPLTNAGALQDIRLVLTSPTGPGAIFRANVFADYTSISNVNISTQTNLVMLSDTPSVISVGADGRLTTVALGSANITAAWQGFSNTVPVTVAVPGTFSLLHRYSFDEQVGDFIVHDSVGGANGAAQGPQPQYLTFTGTNGLKMNGYPDSTPDGIGQGYVALPNPMLSDLSEVTIEAWVNWTPGNVALGYGSGGWQRIFDFGNSSAGEGLTYLFMTAATDNVSFTTNSVYHSAVTTNSNFSETPQLSWTNRLPTNVLTFVALTYSPSRGLINMYLNGAMVVSGTAVIPLSSIIDTNCWLGRSQFSADPYFNGIFREFRVFNGFLSDSDITQDYVAGQSNVLAPRPGPEISTLPAAEVSDTLASLQGMVNPNGQDTQVYFQYGPTINYGTTTPLMDVGSGTNRLVAPGPISGLTSLANYHYRCIASNATAMFVGADITFTTKSNIVTLPATSVGGPTATINAGFAADGQSYTAYFEYGTTTNLGNSTAPVLVNSTNPFVDLSASLTNLATNATYYYSLVVSNQNGVLVSAATSFATGPLIPFYTIGIGTGKIFSGSAFLATPGTYYFQWSTNFTTWNTLESVGVINPPASPISETFSDNAADSQHFRFFRLYRP